MAQHEVVIRNEMGMRLPSTPKVPVTAGGQIKFTAAPGADSALFFSPKAAANLSPAPNGPVTVSAGESVTFTFQEEIAGTVVAQAPGNAQPQVVESVESEAILTIHASGGMGASFGAQINPPVTGH